LALTRAQLLAGDGNEGFVLPNQVQGVKAGDGITILFDGTIEVNSQSIRGLMKLGQTAAYADAAYNKYWWPNGVALADVGKQLTITSIDANGNAYIEWEAASGVDWTARGQLLSSTAAGEGNDTLVNIGTERSFLMSDIGNAGNPSGLAYSNSITSSMKVPAGLQTERPTVGLVAGETRFNTTSSKLEVWDGAEWETVASADPVDGSFVVQIKSTVVGQTDVAVIPVGTSAQRITNPSPQNGYLRYNQTTGTIEFYNATVGDWLSVAASIAGSSFVSKSIATTGTDSAIIPAGSTANRQTAPLPVGGYLRYNSDTLKLEYFDGTNWLSVGGTTTGSFVTQTIPVLPVGATPNAVIPAGSSIQRQTSPAPAAGELRFNTSIVELEVWNGSSWIAIPSSTTGDFVIQTNPTTGSPSAVIPAGPTGDRQTVPLPLAGYQRFNTSTSLMEVFNRTIGVTVGAPPTAGLGIDITGDVVKLKIPEAATPPTGGSAANQAIVGSMYYDVNLGALFIYYSNGGSPTWVQVVPDGGGSSVSSVTGTNGITVNGNSGSAETGAVTLDFSINSLPTLP